ncbi:MAG: hypothetical protein GF411_08825 [Candidatus Lokiarchaeota archaeon]|nr:hypothetical protein [Candidatus Lokiarchaeota archaeon]
MKLSMLNDDSRKFQIMMEADNLINRIREKLKNRELAGAETADIPHQEITDVDIKKQEQKYIQTVKYVINRVKNEYAQSIAVIYNNVKKSQENPREKVPVLHKQLRSLWQSFNMLYAKPRNADHTVLEMIDSLDRSAGREIRSYLKSIKDHLVAISKRGANLDDLHDIERMYTVIMGGALQSLMPGVSIESFKDMSISIVEGLAYRAHINNVRNIICSL